MPDNGSDKQEVICTCTGTTKAKIEQLREKGIDTLDKISSATGANTVSCFAKQGTVSNLRLRVDADTDYNGYFDLDNGDVLSGCRAIY